MGFASPPLRLRAADATRRSRRWPRPRAVSWAALRPPRPCGAWAHRAKHGGRLSSSPPTPWIRKGEHKSTISQYQYRGREGPESGRGQRGARQLGLTPIEYKSIISRHQYRGREGPESGRGQRGARQLGLTPIEYKSIISRHQYRGREGPESGRGQRGARWLPRANRTQIGHRSASVSKARGVRIESRPRGARQLSLKPIEHRGREG
jgi:hypothetical protein